MGTARALHAPRTRPAWAPHAHRTRTARAPHAHRTRTARAPHAHYTLLYKVVAKLQKKGSGAPQREPVVSEDEQKAMVAFYHKK